MSGYLESKADLTSVVVKLFLKRSYVSIQPLHPDALELKLALFVQVDKSLFNPKFIWHFT